MSNPTTILKSIITADLCVGCGLCEGVSGGKLKMEFNEEGFLRPFGDIESVKEVEKIVNACPGYRLELPKTSVPCDPIWGPLIEQRTGHATNERLRQVGSSGGALSALISSLLDCDFADKIIHITADEEKPIYNKIQVSTEITSIERAAGSRYGPSAPLAALPSMLTGDTRNILVGKPCDIAGARQFLENEPEMKDRIVLLVSFMCGGMPSIKGTHEILAQLKVKEDELEFFRYRGEGWPGRVKAITRDGNIATMGYDESWGGILRNHIQFRCKICPDAVGQFADIVFADAWHLTDNGEPSFNEHAGRSIILTRTASGEKACKIAMDLGAIKVSPLEIKEMNKMQPYHMSRKQLTLARILAFKVLGYKLNTYKNLMVGHAAFRAGFWRNVKCFLGTLSRYLNKV